MDGWTKPKIRISGPWLESKVLHTIVKKWLEVVSDTRRSINSLNNNGIISVMLRSRFGTTSGPVLFRSCFSEVIILNISFHNINTIEISINKGYLDTLTWDNSFVMSIIIFGCMLSCNNILGFPNEVHFSHQTPLSIPVFPKLWYTELLWTEYAQNYWLKSQTSFRRMTLKLLTWVPVHSSPGRLSVDRHWNYLARVPVVCPSTDTGTVNSHPSKVSLDRCNH